jgi:hypothetical protein
MNDDLHRLERRLEVLEREGLTPSEKDILRFLIKVVKAIEGTVWLGGWVIKVAPFIAAVWFFWDQGMQWIWSWKGQ